MNTAEVNTQLEAHLQRARDAVRAEHQNRAMAAYAEALKLDPDHPEALLHLAQQALLRGDSSGAVMMLERALVREAHNKDIWRTLGLARLASGQTETAADAFLRVVEIDPKAFRARLHLADIHERAGRVREATIQYFGAISAAQERGLWLSDDTTPPNMRERVRQAMAFVNVQRRAILMETLDALRAAHGPDALTRVTRSLDIYLREVEPEYPDSRQCPTFLYFPDLPATTYYDRALFPWYAQLEGGAALIRAELEAVLAKDHGMVPFLGTNAPERVGEFLKGNVDSPPAWDAFFFYRHGERFDANCARCPRTTQILDSLPIVRIREHAPEICFSVLTPGTHILPHRGVTNTRLVTHLPLIVPPGCAINVGGETREWREGECFTFDDTFEHEAWNRGTATRVVLLMDCWNPHLTEVEREALTLLIGAIGDFNRAAGIHR